MFIQFNPPLGEAVTVISPTLFPRQQTTPVLFTARLDVFDYNQLLADGGRIELWSDIGSEEKSDRTWSERQFVDSRPDDSAVPGAYMLSLAGPSRTDTNQSHTLYLIVALPSLAEAERRQFSFTYRIVYFSGNTTWLGDFNQNGTVVLEAPAEPRLHGLILSGKWTLDSSRHAYIWELEEDDGAVEVATIKNANDFHIWALGRDRLLGDFTDASVLFLVPNASEQLTALRPTYVLAASPGIQLSISTENLVTAAGSGSLILQIKDHCQDPTEFIQQIMSHGQLDNWNILASNMKMQAVVLAPTSSAFPIRGTIIPFWPSSHVQAGSFDLDVSHVCGTLAGYEATEFAIIPSNRECIHVFPVHGQQQQPIHFNADAPTGSFLITPVHRLEGLNHNTTSGWGAALLTDYQRVPVPRPSPGINPLPTPPASPPIGIAEQPGANLDLSQSRRTPSSLDSPAQSSPIIITSGEDSTARTSQEQDEQSADPRPHPDSPADADLHRRQNSPARRGCPGHGVLLVLRCFLVSVRTTFRIFFHFIWPWPVCSGQEEGAARSAGGVGPDEVGLVSGSGEGGAESGPSGGGLGPEEERAAAGGEGVVSGSMPSAAATPLEDDLAPERIVEEAHALRPSSVEPETAREGTAAVSASGPGLETEPEMHDRIFRAEVHPFGARDASLAGRVDVVLLRVPPGHGPGAERGDAPQNQNRSGNKREHENEARGAGQASDADVPLVRAAVSFAGRRGGASGRAPPACAPVARVQGVWHGAPGADADGAEAEEEGRGAGVQRAAGYLLRYAMDAGEVVWIEAPESG